MLFQHKLQVVSQHALQQVSRGGVLRGVPARGGGVPVIAFCCGLLLCLSVMAFWFGGLLVWSSGGAEGHNRRPPHQKAITEGVLLRAVCILLECILVQN